MTTWMDQSFFFDWTPTTDPTPVPITAQCETIQIEWDRAAATGPDPVAPYYLEIYTSHYVFPFTVAAGSELTTNFTVPFAPGTQYQICMFDSVGNTGGCQAVYTVYAPNVGQSLLGQCTNFSFPATTLSVTSSAGQYAWIPSCTDLTLKPTSGKPPYQVTIAPALHPPLNISGVTSEGVTWKVALQWAVPFFVGMTDSSGLSWSYGPLHAGEGDMSCLAPSSGVSPGATAGIAIASALVGALLAIFIFFFWSRSRRSGGDGTYPIRVFGGGDHSLQPTPYLENPEMGVGQPLMPESEYYDPANPPNHPHSASYASAKTGKSYGSGGGYLSGYRVEPFQPETPGPTSPPLTEQQTESGSPKRKSQQVYVVHHDQGPAPVSIFTQDGTEVVELPPIYSGNAATGQVPSTSENPSRNDNWPTGSLPTSFVPPPPSGRPVSQTRRNEKTTLTLQGPRPRD